MNTIKIDAFTDTDSKQNFTGGMLFQVDNNCMLYSQGHCLLLDSNLAQILKDGKIPKKLINSLKSRGFCDTISYQCDKNYQLVQPEFFMVDMTNRCNMKCKYCLRNINDKGSSIKISTLEKICKYIQDYCDFEHIRDITIQPWGGEPLLELEAILNMRKWINPKYTRVHFSIETNAILLTPNVIDKLYDAKIGIGISIDGNQFCHDQQRVFPSGEPTYNIVVDNLKQAVEKYNKHLGTITTITRLNYNYIEDILEFFTVDLGLTNIKFNFVHKSKFIDCDELCLTKDEICQTELRIFNKLVDLNSRGYSIVEKNIATKIKNLLFNEYSDICLSKGCCGGRKMVVFDMYGNIFPCELTDFPEQSMGSIFQKEKTLVKLIRESVDRCNFFTFKKNIKCDDCLWNCYCRGGCTMRVISSGKQVQEIDEIECAINTVLYPAIIELILTQPDIVNFMLGERVVLL